MPRRKQPNLDTLYCSFCAKSQHEVRKLIAGPKEVFICDECVRLCLDILIDEIEPARKRVKT